jgi:hypothetical protein
MHVDEFIDNEYNRHNYARFFFLLHRLSAALYYDFEEWIKQYKLFCTYKEKRYRVTGASRLGDVWLRENFDSDHGYDLRVDLEECSNWGALP